MTKRIISLLVAAMLLLTLVPAAALAKTDASESSGLAREQIGKAADFSARKEAGGESAKAIATWDFEEDPLGNGWTFRNDDGDSFNWAWTTYTSHSGEHSITSESYISGYGAQDPDQWAISPEFDVPETGASVSFWVKNYSSSYPDNFSIYAYWVGEGPEPIDENISVEGSDWVQLTYNLPESVNGSTIAFAIRHHDSYNQWALYFDDIMVSEPIDDSAITEVEVHGFPTKVYPGDTAGDVIANIEVDEGAYYTVEPYVIDEELVQYSDDHALEGDTEYLVVAEVHATDGYHFFQDADLLANYGNMETFPSFTYVSDDGLTAFISVLIRTLADRPIYGWYFESIDELDGWSALDNDGDGENWEWFYGDSAAAYAYEGQGWMGSASWFSDLQKNREPLTPDNYLFTPEISLPEGESTLSFFAAGLGSDYYQEHFAVYIMPADATNINDLVEIFPETETSHLYINYTADLTEYAGQDVIIAFRHFNCTDMNWLRLDQVEIFEGIHEPIESPIITEVDIIDFVVPKYGAAPDYNATVPEDAHYEIAEMSWWTYHDGESNLMEEDAVFDNTEIYYYAYFIVVADEGYDFDMPNPVGPVKDAIVRINGSTEYVDEYSLSPCTRALYIYTVLFQVTEPEPIYLVEINDFVVPEWNATPFLDVTVPGGANYAIVDTYWEWWGEDDGMLIDDIMGDGEVFDNPEVAYYQFFELAPADGYCFADIFEPETKDADDGFLTVLINGGEEFVDYYWFHEENGNLLVCSIDFFVEAPSLITEVDILDLARPRYQRNPDFDVSVPEGANYNVIEMSWTMYDPELGDVAMQPEDIFLNLDAAYYAIFLVEPAEGWQFDEEENLTVMINGREDIVDSFFVYEGQLYIASIGCSICLFGDVNLDGEVTTEDALLAMRYAMGLAELTEEQLYQMEVNGNGAYDLVDATLILRYAMGIIDHFPVEEPYLVW